SALFMDVKGAFDNVSKDRLLHSMTTMGLPGTLITWTDSFLSDRATSLAFDGQREEMKPVQTGIPQGSPISPILFLVYLQPLFTFPDKRHPDVFFPSYIDDVAIVVTGSNEEANSKRLSTIAKEAIRWSESNALSFDGPKTELIHF